MGTVFPYKLNCFLGSLVPCYKIILNFTVCGLVSYLAIAIFGTIKL